MAALDSHAAGDAGTTGTTGSIGLGGADGDESEDGEVGGPGGVGGTGGTGGDGEVLDFLGGTLDADYSGGAGGQGGQGGVGGSGGDGGDGGPDETGGDGGYGGTGGDAGSGGRGGDGGQITILGISIVSIDTTLDLSGGEGGAIGLAGFGGDGGLGGEGWDGEYDDGMPGEAGETGSTDSALGGDGGEGGTLTVLNALSIFGTVDLSGGIGFAVAPGRDGADGDGGTFTIGFGGDVSFGSSATVDLSGDLDGELILDGGTLNLNSQTELEDVLVGGDFIFTAGTIRVNGDATAGGTTNMLAQGLGESTVFLSAGKTLEVGGELSMDAPVFINAGGSLMADSIVTNANALSVLTGGYLETAAITGDLLVQGGTFAPGNSPAITTIDGNYTHTSGSLAMELGGTAPGQYDQLNVNGTLTLNGGSLDVFWYGGFQASVGDSFDLLNWISASGTFDSVILPTLGGNQAWDSSSLYSDGTITVVAVPEPQVPALALLATLIWVARRRR